MGPRDFNYGRVVRHEDLTFRSGGLDCAAWFFRPITGRGPLPCVVLAHGFDGVREQRLDAYAMTFAAAGVAALVFDYRYFGASAGEPRQLVSNKAQLEDWRAAIACARARDEVDPERIALWGTSTSGGHVVKLAAEDQRIAAVIAQVPFADGVAQLFSLPMWQGARVMGAGLKDGVGSLFGRKPHMIKAAGQPGSLAISTSPDALTGLHRITPKHTTWRNEVCARFALTTALYRPGLKARKVGCPLLVCIADGDRLMPIKPALKVAMKAPRGELRRYPVGHFSMYSGPGFERASLDQAEFLHRHVVSAHAAAVDDAPRPALEALP
jgi:alpha-beta hydrolase superfamily lysophospholipase